MLATTLLIVGAEHPPSREISQLNVTASAEIPGSVRRRVLRVRQNSTGATIAPTVVAPSTPEATRRVTSPARMLPTARTMQSQLRATSLQINRRLADATAEISGAARVVTSVNSRLMRALIAAPVFVVTEAIRFVHPSALSKETAPTLITLTPPRALGHPGVVVSANMHTLAKNAKRVPSGF